MKGGLVAATAGLMVLAAACGGGDPQTSSDPVPAGDPVELRNENAAWMVRVVGYDDSQRAFDMNLDSGEREELHGKRYAVTTLEVTNTGDGPDEPTAWFNWEYAVNGVALTYNDDCTLFQGDDYPWLRALDRMYSQFQPGASGEIAICRVVDEADLDKVALVIDAKATDRTIVLAVR